MAFYIPLRLIELNANMVAYEYSQPIHAPDPERPRRSKEIGQNIGSLTLDRSTGEITQLSGSDWDPKGIIFKRAAICVLRSHNEGLYPNALAYEA